LPECFIFARPASAESMRSSVRWQTDRAVVREQDVVGTAAVAEMLVDVYNRLA